MFMTRLLRGSCLIAVMLPILLMVSRIAADQSLEQAGIDVSRIQVQAFGASQPVAANDTVTGHAQNRRVQIIVVRPGS